MTIQVPALAVRASFIASHCVSPRRGHGDHRPGRRGRRARHAGARAGRRHGREAQPSGSSGPASAAATWLRRGHTGRRRALRAADGGCRSAAAGGARAGRRRPGGQAHAHGAAPARSRLADRAAAFGRRSWGDGDARARVEAGKSLHRFGRDARRTPPPPSVPTTAARSTLSARSCIWAVLAALAALAVGGLAGWVSRRRSRRVLRNETVPAAHDVAWVSAHGAGNGFPPPPVPQGDSVIGYVTTSTAAWSDTDEGSSAAIQATCRRSDWNLLEIVADRENGRILERPGLGYALGRIADGHAGALVVSDLQRLSRSIVDLGALMAWFRDANMTLIALDLGIDTSTAEGDRVAATLIALSARAHERIANRTRNRLAERRANGGPNGRPAVRDRPELMERIAAMRSGGLTLQAIADQLNAECVPTLRGGAKWRPSSIQAALGYRRPGPRDHLPRRGTTEGVRGGNAGSVPGVRSPWGRCPRGGCAVTWADIAHPPLDYRSACGRGRTGSLARRSDRRAGARHRASRREVRAADIEALDAPPAGAARAQPACRRRADPGRLPNGRRPTHDAQRRRVRALDLEILRDACRAMTYTSRSCGEQRPADARTPDALGCELCKACYGRGPLENEHADSHHADEPCPDRPDCMEAAR